MTELATVAPDSALVFDAATARDSWTDFVTGKPGEARTETGASIPASEDTGTPVWDLRPVPEMGSPYGAGARQQARMRHLIGVGALQEGIAEGTFTRDRHDPHRKATVRETVVACVPIPLREMMPDWAGPLKGFVTPLRPVGTPEWLRNPSKSPESNGE